MFFRAWRDHMPPSFRSRRRLSSTDRLRNVLIRYGGQPIAGAQWREP